MIEKTQVLDMFVELTRLEDTWEWKEKGEFGVMAHDLAILFNSVTREEYIARMVSKLSQTSVAKFELDDWEKECVQNKKKKSENAIQHALKEMEYYIDEFGNKFGIVFADYELRNDLPEFVRTSGNPENIKYVIIAAMDKGENGQKSYRRVEDDVDVNEIAKLHGGGGHVAAAAVGITALQKEKIACLPKKEALEYLARAIYKLD